MGLDMYFYKGRKLNEDEVIIYNGQLRNLNKKIDEIFDECKHLESKEILNIAKEKVASKSDNPDELTKIFKAMGELEEVQYFRKHSDLHGYLAENYGYQANERDNCVYYVLYREDLEELLLLAKKALENEDIEKHEGFFWGESTESDWKETVKFIEDMLDSINFNEEVIYYSAWY